MIQIEHTGTEFIGRCQYGEQGPLKSAGFRWNPEKKFWWTRDAIIAAKLRDQLTESAKTAVETALSVRSEAIEASRAAVADIEIPAPLALSYLPYQRAGIAYAASRPSVLIADEMGLGKTIQAIGTWNADPTAKTALIVCPASLRLNWQREWQKWDVRGASVGIANGVFPAADVVIINYDILIKHGEALRARTWDLLIVDEAHYAKNPKAKRTQALLGHKDRDPSKAVEPIKARRRIFLTGTPILNKPAELWPLVQALDPQGLGANWVRFVSRYCAGSQTRYGWDVSGASHLDELQDALRATCMVRRLKKDVLTELPAKRRQIITLAGAEKAVTAETEAMQAQESRLQSLRVAVELAKAQDEAAYKTAVQALQSASQAAFTEISKLRHDTAIAKLPQVIEHLRDQIESGKVVVFAHHHDVVDALKAEFGAAAVSLTGETPMAERQANVDRFQSDPSCLLFIGSIHAAGVGITLTAASHVVFAELDWVPGNLSQAEDRCHRIGQTDSVLIQHIVLNGSIDAKMAQTIVEKQEILDQALDAEGRAEIEQIPVSMDQPATRNISRKEVEKEAESLTQDQVQAIHQALKIVSDFCDGAHSLDGMGFSKIDVAIGHSLAASPSLSPRQAALGRKIARKYKRQYGPELYERMN